MIKSLFILSLVFLSTLAKAEISNCSTMWAGGFPRYKENSVRVDCEKFISRRIRFTDKLKMFALPSLDKSPFTQDEKMIIAEALLYSHTRYAQFTGITSVTLLLSSDSYESESGLSDLEAKTYGNFYKNPESCPIVVYPAAKNLSKEHLQQLIAKEVFHCYQAFHFKEQVDLVLRKGLGRWWYEGIALFMSNWVYPMNDLEYSTKYPEIDFERALPQQNNPLRLAHFFQGYFNHSLRKAETVIGIMNQMPTAPYDSEGKAFARIPDLMNQFHSFAEDVILGKLIDSSVRAATLPSPHFEVINISMEPQQAVHLEVKDQKIFSYRLVLPKGGTYKLRLDDDSSVMVSFRNLSEAAFKKLPSEIKSNCDEETKVEILITSVSGDSTSKEFKLEIDRDVLEECQCQVDNGITDSCLFGKWELVHPTVEAFLRRIMEAGPSRIESIKSEGLYTTEFTNQSEALMTASPWDVTMKLKQSDGEVTEAKTSNLGTYLSKVGNGKGVLCSRTISSTMSAMLTMTSRGRSQTIPTPSTSKGLPFYLTYECFGDRLIYHEAFGVGPGGTNMTFDYEFKRMR